MRCLWWFQTAIKRIPFSCKSAFNKCTCLSVCLSISKLNWQLRIAYDSKWQLRIAYDSFWWLLTVCDSFWQLLTAFESLWRLMKACDSLFKLLTAFDNLWQLFTAYASFWQLKIVVDSLWHFLTAYDNFWQLTTIFDSLWQLPCLSSSQELRSACFTWTPFQRRAGAPSLSRSEAAGCPRGLPTDSQVYPGPQDH